MEVATYGLVFLWLVDMKMKVPLSFELLAQSHPFFFFPVPFCSVSNSIRDFFFSMWHMDYSQLVISWVVFVHLCLFYVIEKY